MARSAFVASIFAAAVALQGDAGAAEGPSPLVGTYSGSQAEVGTELRLEANGRFEYYLSYGALDESAQGTWTVDARGLVLTSDPVKPPTFQLVGTKPGKRSELVVTLDVPKGMDAQLFSVFLLQPDGNVAEMQFPADGPLHIPSPAGKGPRKIAVAISVYQVASQPFEVSSGKHALHFRFVPNDLGKVAFDHHRLPWSEDAFVLQRFDRTLQFHKESPQPAAPEEKVGQN